MPDVDISPADRIENLKKARAAAQAIVDEIEQRNTADPFPPRIKQRAPKLLEAQGDVDDLSDQIDDEGAAAKVVTVDEEDVAELQTLAAKLDKAITADALSAQGLGTVTTVLNQVARVREMLDV